MFSLYIGVCLKLHSKGIVPWMMAVESKLKIFHCKNIITAMTSVSLSTKSRAIIWLF